MAMAMAKMGEMPPMGKKDGKKDGKKKGGKK